MMPECVLLCNLKNFCVMRFHTIFNFNNPKPQYFCHSFCMSQVKRDLDKTLLHWAEFDQWHQQVVSWIDDAEQYMDDCTEYKADLPDKRSCCEKYKVVRMADKHS